MQFIKDTRYKKNSIKTGWFMVADLRSPNSLRVNPEAAL